MARSFLATRDVASPLLELDRAPLALIHVLTVLICAAGFTFDLAEIAFGSALAGVFAAAPYSVPPGRLSLLLAATYLGAIAGPPLAGAFADRHGRRRALSVTLLGMGITSLAAACSPGLVALGISRALAGITLGAYPPLMITYLTDVLPARLRGPLTMLTVGIAYLGPPAVLFGMRWVTPLAPAGLAGWRWVILVNGIGALATGALFLRLPESQRWLTAVRGDGGASEPSPEPVGRARFPLMASLFFLAPWSGVAFPVLTAAILLQKGFALSDSLLFVGISAIGPCFGALLAALVADRATRRTSVLACGLGMAVAAIGFCASRTPVMLMLTSFAFNLLLALYTPAVYLYASELVPTRTRARFTSWAWSLNRIAAALSLLVLLPVLYGAGAWPVFAVVAGTLFASVALVAARGPTGRAGLPVE